MPLTDSGKSYRNECTGDALVTVNAHSRDEAITLFGACFCPFVQRVWIAFEYLQIPYKVREVDPYKKPKSLLELSPKGLVPALRLETFDPPRALNESTVILEFLEDTALSSGKNTLLPPSSAPYPRARIRLISDHINRTLIPSFYRFLQTSSNTPDSDEKLVENGKEYRESLEGLGEMMQKAEKDGVEGLGMWKEGGEIGWTDVMVGPWLFRSTNVLAHYRSFDLLPPSAENSKFAAWIDRLFAHPAFKATCSTEDLYIDSYERYAWNRPNTSQVANAINSGRGLP
ncbi:hypothetical protein SISSUDRAFT_1045579 [Sistotremastrum suecicum HHB10207 ss-3]|uniref:Glutathione S-transferase n=1 Tax=Sistotremastrum suecicum HHB10207 ss-3 TaxID=1314776 RepID=A0A166EBS5_9AGAM|nr:hypothetical protein SISSUDRAFT_1045579 [Sistotremastrum suecicum HHB10207 ss-3]